LTAIGDSYEARRHLLEEVAAKFEEQMLAAFAGVPHVDRISFRVKSRLSFVRKIEKAQRNDRPYASPLNDIEDQVAGRILVFFDDDVDSAVAKVKEVFAVPLESGQREPAVDAEFGYESYHEIYSIPRWVFPEGWAERDDLPSAFELQVRTLFQHAYAEPQHDVAYKPTTPLTREEKRELAWIAASAWGADQALIRVRKQIEARADEDADASEKL
jgi:putative GTP pyrophosphokinase